MSQKRNKVIIDTNVWISFLIGRRLHTLQALISERKITIVLSEQLLEELLLVTQRPKLAKYFPQEKVHELISLLRTIGEVYLPNQEILIAGIRRIIFCWI